MFKKNIRTVDKNLLDEIRQKPCAACGCTPSDPCHIKSRGAGGPDTDWNLLAMCRIHHTEQHKVGWFMMAYKYSGVNYQLKIKGWTTDSRNRLVRS